MLGNGTRELDFSVIIRDNMIWLGCPVKKLLYNVELIVRKRALGLRIGVFI